MSAVDGGFFSTADAGHWGPGLGWLFYATLLLWEGLGMTHVLRRRYVEPLLAIVSGGVIFVAHVVVAQKCSRIVDQPGHEWTQSRCYSVNGAHMGLGLYTLLVGCHEFLLHTPFWQRRVGRQAPAEQRQYPFLLASVFLITGVVMGSHEQDTMWQTMAHAYSGFLALLFFALRSFSYQLPGLTLATGMAGIVGSLLFANSSEVAYKYWMNMDGRTNMFGITVSIPFLVLVLAAATITGCALTFVALAAYRLLAPQTLKDSVSAFQHRMAACMPFEFDRLDLVDAPSHSHPHPLYLADQTEPLNRAEIDDDYVDDD